MSEHKITTHHLGDGYYTAEVDGRPLVGAAGGCSRFQSRKAAREEAKRRIEAEAARLARAED